MYLGFVTIYIKISWGFAIILTPPPLHVFRPGDPRLNSPNSLLSTNQMIFARPAD